MTALAPAAIKAALAGKPEPEGGGTEKADEIDPISAAGRRLAKSRGWSPEDLDDLMTMIEAGREG